MKHACVFLQMLKEAKGASYKCRQDEAKVQHIKVWHLASPHRLVTVLCEIHGPLIITSDTIRRIFDIVV